MSLAAAADTPRLRELRAKRAALQEQLKLAKETIEGRERDARAARLFAEQELLKNTAVEQGQAGTTIEKFLIIIDNGGMTQAPAPAGTGPRHQPRYRFQSKTEKKTVEKFDERCAGLIAEGKKLTIAGAAKRAELTRQLAEQKAALEVTNHLLSNAQKEYDAIFPLTSTSITVQLKDVDELISVELRSAPGVIPSQTTEAVTDAVRSLTGLRRDVDDRVSDTERQLAELALEEQNELARIESERKKVEEEKNKYQKQKDQEWLAENDGELRSLGHLIKDFAEAHKAEGGWLRYLGPVSSSSDVLAKHQAATDKYESVQGWIMSANDKQYATASSVFVYSNGEGMKQLVKLKRTGKTWDYEYYYQKSSWDEVAALFKLVQVGQSLDQLKGVTWTNGARKIIAD